MASFRILGPVEASLDGQRLAIGGRRQLTLFSFLVLNANRPVADDALSDAVWGSSRSRSDNRLRMAITRLRKALEPLNGSTGPRLRTVSGGYLLSINAGELDADVFAARVLDGRSALEAGEPARASDLIRDGLELWRGPPLVDVCFEDFAQAGIRRLEELHLVARETRIDADLQLGRHAKLIAELEALLADQPTRERLAGQLMLALYRSQRQTDALDVYQRTRFQLAAQLGLEPGPALRSLQAQILDQSPTLELATGDVAGQSLGTGVGDPGRDVGLSTGTGETHLVYRDADGRQVIRQLPVGGARLTIGRRPDCEISLPWDGEVSRVHAELEAVGSEWAFADHGLSRNGSFLNGERLPGRTLLRDGDAIVVGRTAIVYRRPGPIPDLTTRAGPLTPIGASLTDTDRRVLAALCRPLHDPDCALPASNQTIAEELHLSVPAVKKRLTALFIRFELDRLPQSEKRTRLALAALQHGLVR